MFKTLIFVLITLFSYAGNETGNGGDAIQDEFVLYCKNLSSYFKASDIDLSEIPNFSMEKFDASCDPLQTDIQSVDKKMTLESESLGVDQVKDAVNNSKNKTIKINRIRWISLPIRMRIRLALHEILGYIGVPDRDYSWTRHLFNYQIRFDSLVNLRKPELSEELIVWKDETYLHLTDVFNNSFNYSFDTNVKVYKYLRSNLDAIVVAAGIDGLKLNLIKYLIVYKRELAQLPEIRGKIRVLRELYRFSLRDLASSSGAKDISTFLKIRDRAVKLYYTATSKQEARVLLKKSIYLMIDDLDQLADFSEIDRRRIINLLLECLNVEHDLIQDEREVIRLLKKI
ncbi:MAG: hypothetical protein VX642_01735 [Bdellovibrionota bacterium]|nr:hypothetical protein [Bdellovibrionota bacterium]